MRACGESGPDRASHDGVAVATVTLSVMDDTDVFPSSIMVIFYAACLRLHRLVQVTSILVSCMAGAAVVVRGGDNLFMPLGCSSICGLGW